MPTSVPKDARPMVFSAVELVLDICHAARSVFPDLDVDSLIIYFCVTEATMRPLMLRPETPPTVLTMANPPEQYRGSISMLLISEKLSMPRETVRRKVKAMIAKGLLLQDEDGRIRVVPNMKDPNVVGSARDVRDSVMRYLARLEQFGLDKPASRRSRRTEPRARQRVS